MLGPVFRLLADVVDPFRAGAEGTPPRRVWSFLFSEFSPLRAVVAASLTFTVLGAGLEVWLIGYAAALVDTLATTPPDLLWQTHGGQLLAVAAVVLLVRPLVHLLSEGLDDIAFRPNAQTLALWRAHRYVSRQSVGWFRRDQAGRIAAWVRTSGKSAAGTGYVAIHTLAYVATYIAGSVWLMAAIDARMMVPLAVWIVLYAAFTVFMVPRYRAAAERHEDADSALTGLLVDSYANADTLAMFADRDADDREGRRVFGAARTAYLGVQRLEVTMNVALMTLGSVLMVGLVGYAVMLWTQGAAQLGLIAAAIALSFRITAMAEWLLDGVSSLFGNSGALRAALRVVAQPLAVPDRPGAGALAVTGGAITFTEVSHHYGHGAGGLDRVTLRVAPGEKVGLVGRSGAGKSTLVGLLLRFFEPESGTIEIDGQQINRCTQESLRRQIAVVTQETALLYRSVRDNIAYGGQESNGALLTAAQRAAADGFIATLRDHDGRTGFDAHVGERGVRLSGGQRQRIALARAFYKDAPILVLDEATSALDSEVEAAIRDTLDEVMRGRTVVAIAHRLSTIASMDRIVVLDEGRVAEEGKHADLLARNGLYAALWARQSGGFLGNG